MKSILAVLIFSVCVCVAGQASACNVATVQAFGVVDHCAVAVQAVPVQAFAVQSYAYPSVAVLAQPVVVQQNVVVKQRQQIVRQRSVVRTRTVVR